MCFGHYLSAMRIIGGFMPNTFAHRRPTIALLKRIRNAWLKKHGLIGY